MQYILKLEGQDIPLTPEVAATDETIRDAIAPFFPEATTAEIKRSEADETTIIRMVKKAGTKGNELSSFITAQNQLNLAIELSWQLKIAELKGELTLEKLLEVQPLIQTAILEGKHWEADINRAIYRLKTCQFLPSTQPINGF